VKRILYDRANDAPKVLMPRSFATLKNKRSEVLVELALGINTFYTVRRPISCGEFGA